MRTRSRLDYWLYVNRDRLWRFHHWSLDWLKLAEVVTDIASLGFYRPNWWARAFELYLDRGWL